ncbi:MAG: ABC transporter permease [Syntrophomonadaceae bacterium]|jgi:glycine betaine/proline transport system permease protein|nr:proline/glycine betaine ABC transporter permease [Bacillota bacterium]HQA49470.1 proline/glycine betaine ABC transporter permease [Syntrophomonadaceae bacterium]HQD90187.1 proline/glycine betaine ABC transporter permease [Syntrophomonadaceae bacterium]
MNNIPRIPLAKWTDMAIDWLTVNYQNTTQAISDVLKGAIVGLQDFLISIPPELVIIVVALIAWWLAGKRIALFSLVGLAFIYNIQLWNETMQTIAMVIAAVSLCIIIGVPLGILTAKNMTAHRIITPILDFMQTLPAFVYLLPAIPFFGLGVVPAVITTLIFAMPPIIRLTDLGIKQVPEELVELGKSFGSTFFQMLFKIELPLARPTILAGINQCIMLSLSMVVIAAMIGAKGLGGVVWTAIQTLKMGMGFEAGVAIVIIAIILDRITQNLGKTN